MYNIINKLGHMTKIAAMPIYTTKKFDRDQNFIFVQRTYWFANT